MAQKTIVGSYEFDKNPEREPRRIEVEQKLQPIYPEHFDAYREASYPIEQLYLSHPDEPYSLRLREIVHGGEVAYSAAIKNRGSKTKSGLQRMEISTSISEETYRFFRANPAFPVLRKLRTDIVPGVTIDWFEDDATPVIEVEDVDTNLNAWRFLRDNKRQLADVTGDLVSDNERRAHLSYRRAHDGSASLELAPQTTADEIVADILEQFRHSPSVVATIAGRSGSGKSTLVRDVQERLSRVRPKTPVAIFSTDDYHRGKTWLETTYGAPWQNWDAPVVYDVHSLALDLYEFRQGKAVESRRFDFASQEPVCTGLVEPASIILVEGIYAASPVLAPLRNLGYQVPTNLATCIGRRLERDLRDGRTNTSLGTPEEILRYQLEVAEPAYQAQFSAREAQHGETG